MGLWGSGVQIPPLRPIYSSGSPSLKKAAAVVGQAMQHPDIALIVAMDEAGVIGLNGDMPWHLPDDLRHFRELTWGKPIIMGRNTFVAIGRALPGRHNIVLSRHPQQLTCEITGVATPEAALQAAGEVPEIMVIGGAMVYRAFLDYARRLYVTRIDAQFPGDTYFPAVDWPHWRQVSQIYHSADERHAVGFWFTTWERQAAVI